MMKKWVDFVETKFHLNEHIEWYHVQLELNWNSIDLKFNGIELNTLNEIQNFTLKAIQISLDEMKFKIKLNWNWIAKKFDANWCTQYWK